MLEFLKNLFNQPWIGAILGLIGIFFGLYQIFRRQRGRLVYQTNTRRLIGNQYSKLPSDVEVLYKKQKVNSLTSSRIIIWNDGRSPIRRQDISNNDPLRIKIESNEEILDIEVLSVTKNANQFMASKDESDNDSIIIDFDFLDKDDGAYIEILHTGKSNLNISGTLIGLPEGAKYLGSTPTDTSRYKKMLNTKEEEKDSNLTFGELVSHSLSRSMLIVFANLITITRVTFFVSILILIYALFPSFVSELLPNYFEVSETPESRVPLVILGSIYLFFGFVFIWIERRRYPKALDVIDD